MKITDQLLYTDVSQKPELSTAIRDGVIKIGYKEYIYVRAKDALIIKDYILKYKERKATGESWEKFVEFANNNKDGVKI
jgi:hypothetical protein